MGLISIILAIAAVAGSFVGFFVESWQWFGWVVFGISMIRIIIDIIRYKEVWFFTVIFDILVPGGIALGLSFLLNPVYNFGMRFCFLFNIVAGILSLYQVLLAEFQLMGDAEE